MTNTAYYGLHSDIAGDHAATSYGIMNSCGCISSILAPVVTGFLVQSTGNFSIAFIVMILLNLTAAISVFLFHQPDQARQTFESVSR